MMKTPYVLAWSINNDMGIDDADERIDVDTICRPELVAEDATSAALLAVICNSACRDTVYQAARELASRIETTIQPLIADRAARMMREQS